MARTKVETNIYHNDVKKLFYVNMDYGKGSEGKPHQEQKTFRTKKEAKKALDRLGSKAGPSAAGGALPVRDAAPKASEKPVEAPKGDGEGKKNNDFSSGSLDK